MSTMFNKGFTIAVSGKGGVGKTNICALLIRCLSRIGSVLAVDADPDSNLPHALGVTVRRDVGGVREKVLSLPPRSLEGKTRAKQEILEQELADIADETDDFDIVVMGQPEGEGCYCAVNHILRQIIDTRSCSYDYTVIDCEAGLEHMSRRTTRDVDILVVFSDPTVNGLQTAKRVGDLATGLRIDFGTVMVVANKVTPEAEPLLLDRAKEIGVEIAATIPYDDQISLFDISGRPIWELPEESAASLAAAELCRKIFQLLNN